MKKMRKLFVLIAALVMSLGMAASVSAADSVDIKINDGATSSGSVYAAYKLMDATHDGGTNYSYTVNEKYRTYLQTASDKTTDADIIAYIGSLSAEQTRTFADNLYMALQRDSVEADYTSSYSAANGNHFLDVGQGYYLIAETSTANGAHTQVLLDTKGQSQLSINVKESTPKVVKKVQECNDSNASTTKWRDAADYDIGDDVPFKLESTLPDNYSTYKSYKYVFHDEMADGLTLNTDSIYVQINGTTIDSTYYRVETTGLTDDCTFEVVFDNLKTATDALSSNGAAAASAEQTVNVYYTAKLNSNAKIGAEGNPNVIYLEYSNNPYATGDGTTGTTPEDRVVVFTYELDVNKTDSSGNALSGAGFTLYKKMADQGGNYVKVSDEITGVTTFAFKGLDAGDYKLVETTVPQGYNKADDVEFRIKTSTTELETSEGIKLEAIKITNDNDNELSGFTLKLQEGLITTSVVNRAGSELPSTGGIGTRIFYIVGGILAGGALLLLIVKRRMKNYQN